MPSRRCSAPVLHRAGYHHCIGTESFAGCALIAQHQRSGSGLATGSQSDGYPQDAATLVRIEIVSCLNVVQLRLMHGRRVQIDSPGATDHHSPAHALPPARTKGCNDAIFTQTCGKRSVRNDQIGGIHSSARQLLHCIDAPRRDCRMTHSGRLSHRSLDQKLTTSLTRKRDFPACPTASNVGKTASQSKVMDGQPTQSRTNRNQASHLGLAGNPMALLTIADRWRCARANGKPMRKITAGATALTLRPKHIERAGAGEGRHRANLRSAVRTSDALNPCCY